MKKRTLFISFLLIVACVPFLIASDTSHVNPVDRWAMRPYSETLDKVGDVTQYLAFLTPGLTAFNTPSHDWVGNGLAYVGTAGISLFTRSSLKSIFDRDRPYTYFSEGGPEDEANKSFPSGHAIMAFSGAAYTTALYALRYPGESSLYRTAVIASSWALAGTTAVLRVAAGTHFVTDVLAGAAIGTTIGFGVPYLLHSIGLLKPGNEPGVKAVSISPGSLSIALAF